MPKPKACVVRIEDMKSLKRLKKHSNSYKPNNNHHEDDSGTDDKKVNCKQCGTELLKTNLARHCQSKHNAPRTKFSRKGNMHFEKYKDFDTLKADLVQNIRKLSRSEGYRVFAKELSFEVSKCLSIREQEELVKLINRQEVQVSQTLPAVPDASIIPKPTQPTTVASILTKGPTIEHFLVQTPNVDIEKVIGLELVKAALNDAVFRPIQLPRFYKPRGPLDPTKTVLMFGPPGNGKTMLASAIATKLSCATFLSATPSALLSRWHGESEKAIAQLFNAARANTPAIIFIDEIDSMCSERQDEDSDTSLRMKAELLIQMSSNKDNILLLGATNVPWLLDPAFRRRFEKRIYVPLPDEKHRTKMLRVKLEHTLNILTDSDYKRLGKLTNGFSGSDLETIVREAQKKPLEDIQKAQYFKPCSGVRPDEMDKEVERLYTPCTCKDPKATKMRFGDKDFPFDDLAAIPIAISHVIAAIKRTSPSVGQNDLVRLQKFQTDYGDNTE